MSLSNNPLVILVGMSGCGKSTVSDYLKDKGFPVIYFGGVVIDELKKNGSEVNEQNEKKMRNSIRVKYGMAAMAVISIDKIRDSLSKSPTIIDGVYSWSEVKYLKENIKNPIHIVSVLTDKDIRYSRLNSRKIRPLTYLEAEQRDISEIESLEKGGPIAFADFFIINNSDTKTLFQKIDNSFVKKVLGI